ncbi:hypothetical protein [Fodinicola acaciae]|uniref:hypothetical protein n=1 Tax=Fodinicola acaciae TaxID=2681555 RepID=UPI0013D1A6BC|nr:hypothetical protein [Fodinicola acaciae]
MATDEELRARAGHSSTLDLAMIEKRLQAADETIAAARERLEERENPPEPEAEPTLSAADSLRLATVHVRARLAATRSARSVSRPTLSNNR